MTIIQFFYNKDIPKTQRIIIKYRESIEFEGSILDLLELSEFYNKYKKLINTRIIDQYNRNKDIIIHI